MGERERRKGGMSGKGGEMQPRRDEGNISPAYRGSGEEGRKEAKEGVLKGTVIGGKEWRRFDARGQRGG